MPVTAGRADEFTTDLAQAAVKLAAVPRGVFAHRSGGENKFVAEGRRDGASGFKQRFQMRLRGLLKTKHGFAPVTSVSMAAGQERRFRNPHAIFVLTELHFREWNDHNTNIITRPPPDVKQDYWRAEFGVR